MAAPKLDFSRRSSRPDDVRMALSSLSTSQVDKLSWFYDRLLDPDHEGGIDAKSMEKLNNRIREFVGWTIDSEEFKTLQDLHRNFFQCMIDQVRREAECGAVQSLLPQVSHYQSVTRTQWLNMWGRLTEGAVSMTSFPYWCQILPQMLFRVADRDDDGEITETELRNFYRDFIQVEDNKLEAMTKAGYQAMTASGDYKLTMELFSMSFANFLLGRSAYGPGKYVLGYSTDRVEHKYDLSYH